MKITKDLVLDNLISLNQLNIPVHATLPTKNTMGGQLAGIKTATGVDFFYYDGESWIKVVDSSSSEGLPSVLALNNRTGGVNNIILDNNGGGNGSLTSDVGDDLNIIAGAANTSTVGTTGEEILIQATKVTVDSGTGDLDLGTNSASHTTTIGSTTGVSTTVIQGSSGSISLQSDGISLQSGGKVYIQSPGITIAGNSLILNVRVGRAIYTGLATLSGDTEDLTIVNQFITSDLPALIVTVANTGDNDAIMTLEGVTYPGASGSIVVHTQNNGSQTLDGNIIVSFWVLAS